MVNTGQYTSITVTKDTREELNMIKGVGESYSDVIKELIKLHAGVIVDNVKEVERPQVALELQNKGLGGNNASEVYETTHTLVTFKDLSESEVGDKFETEYLNYEYSIDEEAEVIFKDEDSVLLRLKTIQNLPEGHFEDMELIHVHLF